MRIGVLRGAIVLIISILWMMIDGAMGVRFVIDREECLSHYAQYEGDIIHLSFVVIKANVLWRQPNFAVDFLIKGPYGEQIHEFRDKTSEKHEFMVQKHGLYEFCFINKSPYSETIDFDMYITHYAHRDQQHAKEEHFYPLMEQLSKLREALDNIQFEQHWLEAQTDRQAIVNEEMSERAIHKAMLEAAALIGASVLQVVLLKRLFERKRGTSRV